MIKNIFKIALRQLLRNSAYSIINIVGLTAGLTSFILIMLWVQHEVSYDKFHKNIDRIYFMAQDQFYNIGAFSVTATPFALKDALITQHQEIEAGTRITGGNLAMRIEDEVFQENVLYTDPPMLTIFDFPLVEGDPQTALDDKFSLVVSQDFVEKHFPNQDALGKEILVNNEYSFTITGVIKKVPDNSTYRFNVLASIEFMSEQGVNLNEWGSNWPSTLVLLKEGVDPEMMNKKIKTLLQEPQQTTAELFMHPYRDIHLHNLHYKGGLIEYVYIFGSIAIFILVLACVNFTNLSTARATKRAKEIGLRKTVGSSRGLIIIQFIGESLLISFLALCLSIILAESLLIYFNTITQKQLFIDYTNPLMWLILIGTGLLTGAVAGAYPALFISRFSPSQVLKGNVKMKSNSLLRKSLVVFQFAISVALIAGTLIVSRQLNYLTNRDLGMAREGIVYFSLSDVDKEKIERLKNQIKSLPVIEQVTWANTPPNAIYSNGGGWNWLGKDPETDILVASTTVGENYFETFDMKMKEGRAFSASISNDTIDNIIINETFANIIAPNGNAIGKIVERDDSRFNVIGVVKDFHFTPINRKSELGPLMIFFSPVAKSFFCKVSSDDYTNYGSQLSNIVKEAFPNDPINLSFLDDRIKQQYFRQEQMADIFTSFVFLAVIISALGLYGLSLFMSEQRRKEISIRKAIGANITSILKLMMHEFVRLAIIANLIALPVAYYYGNDWLNGFAYHTSVSAWIFLATFSLSVLIAVFTVFQQSYKAATTNPVKYLSSE